MHRPTRVRIAACLEPAAGALGGAVCRRPHASIASPPAPPLTPSMMTRPACHPLTRIARIAIAASTPARHLREPVCVGGGSPAVGRATGPALTFGLTICVTVCLTRCLTAGRACSNRCKGPRGAAPAKRRSEAAHAAVARAPGRAPAETPGRAPPLSGTRPGPGRPPQELAGGGRAMHSPPARRA